MERLQRALEDRYTVEVELGRGGVGAVYRALDRKHGRKVAVKVLLPEVANAVSVSRFLQEITIAARLNHPHILPLHDSGEAEGLVFYVMPWIQGKSLRDRLDREERLSLDDVTRIAGEVGSALDRAHGEGILHRDIKPANILLLGNYAVLADFGIATVLDATGEGITAHTGGLVGTAAYMSPEQASGSADVDGRSDLYSLGCTVYEMLVGHPPFRSSALRRVLTQHLVEPVPPVRPVRPDVPEHVEAALMKALEKDPDDRFPTLMEFANALVRPVPVTSSGYAGGGEGLWSRIRSSFAKTPSAVAEKAGSAPGPEEVTRGVPEEEGTVRCGACGSSNAKNSRYCRECGERLGAGPAITAGVEGRTAPTGDRPTEERVTEATIPPPDRTELRQLTVMTVDARPMTAPLVDPEAELEVIQEYQAVCEEAVSRYEGQVVQKGTYDVVTYFGHPVAHEDDAIRAGLAGLGILSATRVLSARLQEELGIRLDVRIGVHTGPAVIGPVGPDDTGPRVAIGPTPQLSSLLKDRAPPDSVLVSGDTHRLFRGFFSCQELGELRVDGSDDAVPTYRVLAESGMGRLSSLGSGTLPRLVGREAELREIEELWGRAAEGAAQLVLVSGEAGIGKSRLVAAVRERLADESHLVLQAGCSPYHTNTPLYGVISLLERWFGIHHEDPLQERFRKLEEAVLPRLEDDPDAVPLLASLLSIPLGEGYEPLSLEPGLQRRRTLELLLKLLRVTSERVPVLLVLEDLHWVDPSTLEFLTMWLDRARTTRTLVLLDARPEFRPPWEASHVAEVKLAGLDVERVMRIVEGVTEGKSLPQELVDQIVRRADGVPLFVEETTRSFLESDQVVETEDAYELVGPVSRARVPLTLRDALTARIDRLGPAKPLVQLGAVIGREFSAALLHEVSGLNDWVVLGTELARAVDAGILQSSGSGVHAVYTFRHALIQENAYQSLVRRTRKAHHRRIMETLEERFPETAEAHPELLAHHCTEAGATREAIHYWRRTGLQAIGRAAFAEAVHHLRRGLELVASLPEGPDRDREELLLQTSLGMALQASKGYASPEVERVYERARILGQKGGAARDLLPVLWGHYLFYGVRARFPTSLQVGEEMLALARRDGEPEHLLVSHLALGLSMLYMGRFGESREHFRKGLELYEPGNQPLQQYQTLGDPGPFSYSYLARTLWILGEVGGAFDCSHRSLALARTLKIPLTQTQALGMHTLLLMVHGDLVQAGAYAEETMEYASRHGFAYWLVLSSMYQGWLIAQGGRLEEGITRFRRFLEMYRKQGAELGLSWFYGVLAQMVARSGRTDEAVQWIDRARDHVEATEERYYEAEIHRIRAEVELLRGGPEAREVAEGHLARALAVARAQRAKSWELRAALSLARMKRDRGCPAEARKALEILDRMPEQPDPSADLRQARRLLEELE